MFSQNKIHSLYKINACAITEICMKHNEIMADALNANQRFELSLQAFAKSI